MVWDKGFNFRATSGFVTDGASETYVLEDPYPTTRNGVTFGWVTITENTRDRDNAVDRRLAGINFQGNDGGAIQRVFRIDLDAMGDYIISLAGGDDAATQTLECSFLDNTTVFAHPGNATVTGVAEYVDATGVVRTQADWPTQHATIARTFASTIFNVRINDGATISNSSCLAHVFVSQVATAGATAGKMNTYRQRRI